MKEKHVRSSWTQDRTQDTEIQSHSGIANDDFKKLSIVLKKNSKKSIRNEGNTTGILCNIGSPIGSD